MNISKRITKRVREAEIIPNWYGISYWYESSMEAVCHPIPLNWIVNRARRVRHYFKSLHHYPSVVDRAYSEGVNAGRISELRRNAEYPATILRMRDDLIHKVIHMVVADFARAMSPTGDAPSGNSDK